MRQRIPWAAVSSNAPIGRDLHHRSSGGELPRQRKSITADGTSPGTPAACQQKTSFADCDAPSNHSSQHFEALDLLHAMQQGFV